MTLAHLRNECVSESPPTVPAPSAQFTVASCHGQKISKPMTLSICVNPASYRRYDALRSSPLYIVSAVPRLLLILPLGTHTSNVVLFTCLFKSDWNKKRRARDVSDLAHSLQQVLDHSVALAAFGVSLLVDVGSGARSPLTESRSCRAGGRASQTS